MTFLRPLALACSLALIVPSVALATPITPVNGSLQQIEDPRDRNIDTDADALERITLFFKAQWLRLPFSDLWKPASY